MTLFKLGRATLTLLAAAAMLTACGAAEDGELGTDEEVGSQQQLLTGYYEIHPRHSGGCLDVYNASGANGASVVQWSCTGGSNQQWKLVNLGTGFYELHPRHSNACADINLASTANGADLVQWACTAGYNQQFSLVYVSSGYYEIHPRHTNKCLDVDNAGLGNGAQVQQWTCSGLAHQQFYFAAL